MDNISEDEILFRMGELPMKNTEADPLSDRLRILYLAPEEFSNYYGAYRQLSTMLPEYPLD